MIVKQTTDIKEIKSILCHPDIYNCIADDTCVESKYFNPPMDSEYIGGYTENNIFAIMIYRTIKNGLDVHIQVLPEYRERYAREFARMALDFGKAKNAIIYAEIPTCFQNVINFTKSFGFKEHSVNKDYWIKDGKSYNSVILRLDNVVC